MKLKSILSISSVLMLLAILVSSCGSTLNITKKRHSNGYYVNIGNDDHDGLSKAERRNKKHDLSKLIENKINNDNLASNVEAGDDIDGEKSDGNGDFKNKNLSAEQIAAAEEFSRMSTLKKIKALKKLKNEGKLEDNTDFMLILLILLSIILSPVAIFLKDDGISNHFWINLLMWAIGIGAFGIFAGGALAFLGILWLFAVVHALLYVFGII
ncbi:MAG: uncharacterized membrane protein YqaE (UPF0057 family) [Saprospiraceae bacterium]|jgi:uncharacterized membrane protein YqaE (UPF0057 family)